MVVQTLTDISLCLCFLCPLVVVGTISGGGLGCDQRQNRTQRWIGKFGMFQGGVDFLRIGSFFESGSAFGSWKTSVLRKAPPQHWTHLVKRPWCEDILGIYFDSFMSQNHGSWGICGAPTKINYEAITISVLSCCDVPTVAGPGIFGAQNGRNILLVHMNSFTRKINHWTSPVYRVGLSSTSSTGDAPRFSLIA